VVNVSGGIDASSFAQHPARLELRGKLGLTARTRLLVSVRRLDTRMGLEELLHAAALLQRRGTDFVLAIAGDGILEERLRSLARQLELGQRVRFLGRISETQLRDLYATADLSVLPTIAYEGFGMATIESLASGTPVVGTAVGATPELLAPLEPRLVAACAAPRELADAIGWAIEHLDDRFRERCAEYARAHFDWAQVIERWESALQRTIAESRLR
jgi:glycosyltransferase involved in cell wall biosynthesis